MLVWARRQWEHANDHVTDPDALEVLERVDAGERFACVEYSIVLSQALNAARIPGRRLSLRQRHHHVGVGRGHVVSEAWVDDLDRWVLLDGQNGAYWEDLDGQPLGVPELARDDDRPVRMVGLVEDISDEDAAVWQTYFESISTTGYTWAAPGFSPVFQESGIIKTDQLLNDRRLAYPRLSEIAIACTGTLAEPLIRLETRHPYAAGFRVNECHVVADLSLADPRWALSGEPGRHTGSVAVVTGYGTTAAQTLEYEVRGA